MIINCSMFLNENDVLEIKLNQHWSFVDKFFVFESSQTHTGDQKPYRFDIERFRKYAAKLEYVQLGSLDEAVRSRPDLICPLSKRAHEANPNEIMEDWIRDHVNANLMIDYVKHLDDDTIIVFDCLDEILSEEGFVNGLKRFPGKYTLRSSVVNASFPNMDAVFGFNLSGYAYKLNLKTHDVVGSMMTTLRNCKQIFPTTLRKFSLHTHPPINGGWHLSWMDPTNGTQVLQKYKSWAHSRDKSTNYYGLDTPQQAVNRLLSYAGLKKTEVSRASHPAWLVDNLDKFQDLLFAE